MDIIESQVTFGKYKGQPVATMLADQNYVSWLTQQPWFEKSHTKIYQIIVNGGMLSEEACTPEHNAMQLRFLEPEVQTVFDSPQFEHGNWDVIARHVRSAYDDEAGEYFKLRTPVGIELKPSIGDDYPAILRKVIARTRQGRYSHSYILRDLRPVVICDTFDSRVGTFEQVQALYEASHVTLIKWEQINFGELE